MKILSFLLIVMITSCTSNPLSVKRISADSEKALSGYWNDTDSKLVATELISQVTKANWLSDFSQKNNRKPIVVVGKIRNKTSKKCLQMVFVLI